MSNVILTQSQYSFLFEMAKRVKNMSGDGVTNNPDGITITPPDVIAPAIPPSPERFRVTVATDGGTAGNKTTQCSFTYTVTSLGSAELGAGMTPAKARPPLGAMVVGDDIGWAYYSAGVFTLWDANEVIDAEAC